MDLFGNVKWDEIFVPTTSLLEIFIRGTLVYLSLFLLLRFILKRQAGALGITDVLVVVLIADAAQNAMASDYKSVPEGLLLVSTIIFWCYALDWLSYRFPMFGKWITPKPLELVRDGEIIEDNMRKELVSRDELDGHLREKGVSKVKDVKSARMESEGKISVVKKERNSAPKPRSNKKRQPAKRRKSG